MRGWHGGDLHGPSIVAAQIDPPTSVRASWRVVSSTEARFDMPALATRTSRRPPHAARIWLASACGPPDAESYGAVDVGAAAGSADLRRDGFGLRRAAVVVDEDSGAGKRPTPAHWHDRCRAARR